MNIIYKVILCLAIFSFSSCSSDERLVIVEDNNEVAGEGDMGNDDDNDNNNDGDDGNNSVTVKKRILIEDYVATWCGNCILAIEKSEQADKSVFVPVAIHFLGSTIENKNAINVASENKVSSQTTVIIDKHTSHSFRNDIKASDYSNASLVAIGMNSSIAGSNLNFDLKFKFYNNFSSLKYTVYLLQNGIVASQANYQFSGSIYESQPRTISNFKHNHVLQDVIFNQLIPVSESVDGNVYENSHSFNIENYDSNELELVVYVESETEALNTQIVAAGENVDFHAER